MATETTSRHVPHTAPGREAGKHDAPGKAAPHGPVPAPHGHHPAARDAKHAAPLSEQPLSEKDAKRAGFDAERKRRWSAGVDWGIAFWIALLHVGALAAPFTFTWQGLVLMFVLGWMTGGLGICLGYHRLLTHSSFKTYKPVKWFLAWLGGLAGQGSAVHWVANHRKHHADSDDVGDPHSPVDGPWWAHMFWFMPKMAGKEYVEYNRRWAPDLARDGVLVFLDRTFLLWHLLMGLGLYGAGYWLGGTPMALSFLVWGLFLRLVYVLHSTWFVNSATHLWGYRNYETTDHSTNLWWVALVTYGEGWHNNHHAYPRMARHGHKWWEFDTTWVTIRAMKIMGLAWDVVDNQHNRKTEAHTLRHESHGHLAHEDR